MLQQPPELTPEQKAGKDWLHSFRRKHNLYKSFNRQELKNRIVDLGQFEEATPEEAKRAIFFLNLRGA